MRHSRYRPYTHAAAEAARRQATGCPARHPRQRESGAGSLGAAGAAIVAVDPAQALEQEVDGGQVADQQVEVDIQGLLGDLGSDHHMAFWARTAAGGRRNA